MKSYKVRRSRIDNLGLAENIISGVSTVINKYGKVIVLEDDLLLSKKFLSYMNATLDFYETQKDVFHISGYWYPVEKPIELPETFFLQLGTCWGWGTWKRAWDFLETNPSLIRKKVQSIDQNFEKFNLNGRSSFLDQLDRNISGDLSTWAVKWYGSIFMNGGLSLHPNISYVNNIRNDSSGENCSETSVYDWEKLNQHNFKAQAELKIHARAVRKLEKYFNQRQFKLSRRRTKVIIMLKKFLPHWLIGSIKYLKINF